MSSSIQQNQSPKNVKEEVLLLIPECRVHLLDASEPLELASGEFKLVKVSSANNVTLEMVVRVGHDHQWPVVKDEPVEKVNARDYIFTLPVKDGNPRRYGVAFSGQEEDVDKSLEFLEKFMKENSCFSSLSNNNEIDWKEFAPKADEYKSVVAKAIAGGTGHIIKGIFTCSNSYSKKVHKGGGEITTTKEANEKSGDVTSQINKGDNNETKRNNKINTNLQRVEKLWKASETVGIPVLDGGEMVSGSIMAPVLKSKLGKALLSTAPGEVLLASLDSFTAEIQTHTATSMAATKLVSKSFGENAGKTTAKVLETSGSLGRTAWKIQKALDPSFAFTTEIVKNAPGQRNFTNPKLFFPLRLNETPTSLAAKRVSQVRATVDGDGKTGNWVNRLPIPGLGAENVFRLISSATGSPIGQFISSHVTFLRSVDPRIKLRNDILFQNTPWYIVKIQNSPLSRMGNCIALQVSCDRCLNQASHWLCVRASYIPKLKENLAALDTNMEELKAKRDDVSRRVKREEDRGLQRLAEIQKVEDLKSSGAFELVADQHTQASSVEERPIGHTIVGQKSTLQDAWKYLMEDGVGIIGVYGMGGVGKTTLLMQINNKIFDEGCLFDDVIWSVVSKDLQIQKIQDDIAKKLDIYCEEWNKNDESQKACKIYNILKKKKFVLLLDDIWEKVELSKIGVPSPSRENGCKVVLTTRSQGVCGRMGANADMEVRCLEAHDALDLFKKKIGKVTLESHSGIPELAKKVAKKCHGLPLALNVIGETMARKRTIQEWQRAIDVLNPYAAEFSGMKDEILPVLKYSYDSLMDEQLKMSRLISSTGAEEHLLESPTLSLSEANHCRGLSKVEKAAT
ncbi:hypothetical protein AALP_AA3G268400 [Arabis alpina]|uniref:NB-ARC domain-containing protein n=1 Tax=Arabis alpina TaxID=50452 RepID=A0A087HBX6_ARAAL|nr:hypothetical protein AALP_AA3G268400 [Arabis alpina]